MSKKTFMAAIIISAFLVSIVAGMQAAKVARANPFGYLPTSPNKDPPTIILESLSYDGNNSDIELNFAVTIPDSWNSSGYLDRNCYVYQINCEIDNQSILTLNDAVNVNGLTKDAQYKTTNLTNLTVGQHILQINISSLSLYNPPPLPSNWLDPYCYYSTLTQKVPISVDAESNVLLSSPLPNAVLNSYSVSHYGQGGYSLQPNSTETVTLTATPSLTPTPSPSPAIPLTISILSPVNNSTFISAGPLVSFPLTYETNGAFSWVGYSIDGSSNVTISNNDTVAWEYSDLEIHNLTLYANDTFGSWAAPQTIYYFITVVHSTAPTPSPSPTLQPTLEPSQTPDRPKIGDFAPVIIIAALVVAVIVVASLVYFRKKRG